MLANGLRVIIHEDHSIPLAVLNILYNVGSKDEDPGKTGFAHLFEHLMFGGSVNIPSFDEPLQKVGGENNAFTSSDITNYYIQLPAINIETAFWLESDRMLGLSMDPKVIEVQKKVVIEEFKQRYLNQPYGDIWLKLWPLAYRVHPYRWPTIGMDIGHIEHASLEDVSSFFKKFYNPANAILSVAGDVAASDIRTLAEKWFGPIPSPGPYLRNLPSEPTQGESRKLDMNAHVPLDALHKVYHMPGRKDESYHAADFLSEMLGKGKSSRLYLKLVKEKKIFNTIDCYITGTDDPGLMVISGKINGDHSLEEADREVNGIIEEIREQGPTDQEVTKMRNQAESGFALAEVELLNKAMNLAYFANIGDPEWYNLELDRVLQVSARDIISIAGKVLREENGSTLFYHADQRQSGG